MNPLDLLPGGFGVETAILLSSMMSAFGTVLFVWQALLKKDPMAARMRQLAVRRETLRAEMLAARPDRGRILSQVGAMKGMLERVNLLRGQEFEKAGIKLARAGFRSQDAIIVYLTSRLAAPFFFGLLGLTVFMWLEIVKVAPPMRLPLTMACVIVGALAPDIYLRNLAQRRRDAIQKALPDALDLLVICAEAGLSLDAALTRVAREMGNSSVELGDEFGLTAIELGFLPDRRKALDNLNMRTDMPAIRGLVNTLQQTEKYGTPLAQSLRVLSSEFRDQRMMRAEEKAARLPAIMTVPMIIFIMPALFIVLIGPAIIRTIDGLRGL